VLVQGLRDTAAVKRMVGYRVGSAGPVPNGGGPVLASYERALGELGNGRAPDPL